MSAQDQGAQGPELQGVAKSLVHTGGGSAFDGPDCIDIVLTSHGVLHPISERKLWRSCASERLISLADRFS